MAKKVKFPTRAGHRLSKLTYNDKFWTILVLYNIQNKRMWVKVLEDMPMEVRVASKWQISSSAMVWLGMTTDSQKTPFKTFPVDIRDNHNMFLFTMELVCSLGNEEHDIW